jgi:dolichol-phosphate mannosyltransferase
MEERPGMESRAGWSLSLVIPAFNEEDGIAQAVAEADDALARLADDYEVLIVDDGSTDGTAAAVLEAARSRPRVRLLRHGENRGYGAALRTGFETARFDRVAFTDADCQFDLADLASLLSLADHVPVAVGYRVARQDVWRRRFFSAGYNLLARSLLGTGVRDCDCALKVFRKDALARLLPESRAFFVNTEMLTRARQLGYAVSEVGVRHRPRVHGCSKVSLGDIPRTLATLLPFWWSRVLFAGDAPPTRRPSWRGLLDVGFWVVFAAAALLFFSRLRSPLLEPDEARYAEIPRQMLSEGRLMVPVLHGQPYYHKPPLLYWLVMGSYATLGVHDWSAKAVPSCAAFLTVLVTYFWGKRLVGGRAALAGALMLCLSARFVYLGRMLTMDSLLGLWVVLSWATAHVALGQQPLRWRWWLVSAAACGLGLLTKGPVALVLISVPLAALQLLDPRTARPRVSAWLTYVGMALGIAGPWYVAVATQDPTFAGVFLWTHNILRFAAPLDHEGPVWYYLPGLLLGMLPWTLLVPSLWRFLGGRSAAATKQRPAGLGLFLLAFLWCLIFYSGAGSKRPGYILPALPPLALALGCHLNAALPRHWFRQARTVATVALNRLAYRATLLVLSAGLVASLAAVALQWQRPLTGMLLAGIAVVGLGYLLLRGPDRRVAVTWATCAAATFIVLLTALHQILPGYERRFSLRDQIRPNRDLVVNAAVSIVCYPHRWDSVSFYLQRDDVKVYASAERPELIKELKRRPSTLLFIKTDDADSRSLHEFLRDLPASLEFVVRGRHGIVTTGVVQRRAEAPSTILARR